MNSNTVIFIENWSIIVSGDQYTAPELRTQHLNGFVKNHPRLKPQVVTTSRIVGRRGELVVTSSGSQYKLGAARPEYEAKYPAAAERLLATLPKV